MRTRVLSAFQQPSLKLALIAIVLVVLLPTLGVVAATLWRASTSFYEASTRQLLETARTVGHTTLQELTLSASVLQHLGAGQATEALVQAKHHTQVAFGDGVIEQHAVQRLDDGRWQMHNDGEDDAALQQLVEQAAQAAEMQLSNLHSVTDAAGTTHWQIVMAAPQAHWDALARQPQQVSTLSMAPQHWLRGLMRHDGGSGASEVILAVTDGQGRLVARSVDSERFVGQRVPDWPLLRAQPGDSGSFTARTLEGQDIVFAFQRIVGTPGWVAVVGESADSLLQRARQPLQVMLGVSVVTVALALLLALLLARKVLQPIRGLVERAQRIAAGEVPGSTPSIVPIPPASVAEFEVLRQSLEQADQALQRSLQESQRAERQAQAHLAVLQAAEEQARIGHWTLDASTQAVHCSDMIAMLFGGPREATVLQLHELRAKLKPESFGRMQAAVQQCLQQGTPYALEVEHLRADGSSFSAYLRGWPVYAEAVITGIAGTLQDISEGKEQHERMAVLADNLPSGVIFRLQRSSTRGLTLAFLSAGLQGLTGLDAAALLHHPGPLLRAMGPASLRRLLRVLQHAQQPGHVLDQEFALHTPLGAEVWIHCRAALRYPGTGGAVWDGIARDVTAERAADAALRAAKEAAERAERAKSDFLATMSHEIRTPMNSVIGMARLAMHTDLDARQRNYLEKINESANVLLGIINDILDFSKMEAGGLVLEGVPFRLESVLDTVAAVTVLKAEEKGIEITYAVDPMTPAMVCGDALRLGQVLTNLVSNAVKFTEAGDVVVRISHQATQEGALLSFEVTDCGIGLTEQQIQHLFQPFAQAQMDTARRYGGTGLGLAISQRLVQMMGGRIGVRSQPGVGSTFFFTVRMPAVEQGAEQLQASTGRTASLRGRRILIADDNRTARMALADMAESFGMQATLANDGQEALQLLHSHAACGIAFEMVVLDWRMPVMDGLEAARLIKSDVKLGTMPAVLMVTAYGQDAMLQASQGMDLQGVLLKPVTQSAMFNTLLQAMSGRAVQTALPNASAYQALDLSAFAALRGQRVLVADDNALNREVATDFLRHVGMQVFTAVDGADAMEQLQAQSMDVVLMDIHMPRMDGLAATREIRRHARWQSLPIIALTAQARGEDVQWSLDAGMNGHLSKPIDELLLYRTLLAHCGRALPERGLAQVDVLAVKPLPPSGGAASSPMFARLPRAPARQAHMLRGFLKDFDDFPERFQQLLAQSQWALLAEQVHQIKGSASYLDATALCELADKIEYAARNLAPKVVHAHAAHLLVQVQACLERVRTALQALEDAQDVKPSSLTKNQDLLDLLAKVRPLLANRDFAAHRLLEDLVQASAGQRWSAQALAALQAFDDLECELALQWLDEIALHCH